MCCIFVSVMSNCSCVCTRTCHTFMYMNCNRPCIVVYTSHKFLSNVSYSLYALYMCTQATFCECILHVVHTHTVLYVCMYYYILECMHPAGPATYMHARALAKKHDSQSMRSSQHRAHTHFSRVQFIRHNQTKIQKHAQLHTHTKKTPSKQALIPMRQCMQMPEHSKLHSKLNMVRNWREDQIFEVSLQSHEQLEENVSTHEPRSFFTLQCRRQRCECLLHRTFHVFLSHRARRLMRFLYVVGARLLL